LLFFVFGGFEGLESDQVSLLINWLHKYHLQNWNFTSVW
jgi:hypothetical protein